MASNLTLRMASAAVLIPVVIAAIAYGGLVFDVFIMLAFALSLLELSRLTKQLTPRKAYLLTGGLYFIISFVLFDLLRDGESGLYLTVTLMVVIWASDTVAYIMGRLIGGPKLAPVISPNKTWAGMAGSMIGAATAFALMLLYPAELPVMITEGIEAVTTPAILLVFYGALFGVIGQLGDLLESWIKRKAGFKDSGNLIPGHGGILDRIDALLLVIPFFYLVCSFGL